jgi:type VI secretion system secreted protein VgrG
MTKTLHVEEHASLRIGESLYEVLSLRGFEAISELFHFDLRCAVEGSLAEPEALLGEAAAITLRDGWGRERRIEGIVAEAESGVFDDGKALLDVIIRPSVYPISLGRDCYTLHDVDVIGVIEDVLYEHTGPVRYAITRRYTKRDFCAQYREDDWTFLNRLLEEEGIVYWFDHTDPTTLVFSDDTRAAPEIPGGGSVPFHAATGMGADNETIEELGRAVQAVSTRFSVTSFDPEKPLFKVSATVGDGPFEVYDAPAGGPNTPASCEALARTQLEIAQAEHAEVRGETTSIRLVPGMVFALDGHPVGGFDGRYLVTEARYEIVQRRKGASGEGGERAYVCRFRAIPQSVPYREPADTAAAQQQGLQLGVVVGHPGKEIHTDEFGRVRVQLHWDRLGERNSTSGKWMRAAQRSTQGSMLLPRTGWHVATFNEEGAIDAPTVLSRLHDGERPPSYTLPANKTRLVWKTATTPGDGTSNEIMFEDQMGAEHMVWNASRDMNVLVQNVKQESIDNDQIRHVGRNYELTVTREAHENIGRDQSVTIAGAESITTGKGRNKTVGRNETATVNAAREVKVKQGYATGITQSRKLVVDGAMIERSPEGNISATCKIGDITVAGTLVRTSDQSISEDHGKGASQSIGGAKIESTPKDRALKVDASLTETVGGDVTVTAGDSFIDDADVTSSWTVTGKLSGTGEEVWVNAREAIRIRCGTSLLEITPTKITLRGDSLDLSGAHLQAVSGIIRHN